MNSDNIGQKSPPGIAASLEWTSGVREYLLIGAESLARLDERLRLSHSIERDDRLAAVVSLIALLARCAEKGVLSELPPGVSLTSVEERLEYEERYLLPQPRRSTEQGESSSEYVLLV